MTELGSTITARMARGKGILAADESNATVANSLGQAGGPLLGGGLFLWRTNAPYLFSGAVLLALASTVGWKALGTHPDSRLA